MIKGGDNFGSEGDHPLRLEFVDDFFHKKVIVLLLILTLVPHDLITQDDKNAVPTHEGVIDESLRKQ